MGKSRCMASFLVSMLSGKDVSIADEKVTHRFIVGLSSCHLIIIPPRMDSKSDIRIAMCPLLTECYAGH